MVADLESASPAEAARFLQGSAVAAESAEAEEILHALGARGMRIAAIDRGRAFEDVRRVRVGEGEALAEAGSSPAFVYVAVDCTLRIEPLGGYGLVDVPPGSRSARPASCAVPSATAGWSRPRAARCW